MEIQRQIEILQKMQINLYELLEQANDVDPHQLSLEGVSHLLDAVEKCDSLLEVKLDDMRGAIERL